MRWSPLIPELFVDDIFASLDFYVKGIGFQILFSREGPLFTCLELNGAQFMFEENHLEAWFVGRVRAPEGRGMGLQTKVSDAGAACSRLAVLGV